MSFLTLLLFAGSALLLVAEGAYALRAIAPRSLSRRERLCLGFPLAAFGNVLLFFAFTLFQIPLTLFVVYGAHALILGVLVFFARRDAPPDFTRGTRPMGKTETLLVALLLLSLSIKVFYAFSHAVLLPSFSYDTVSQWNMRARISYEDRAIAFDTDEARGMSKAQYPILLHSLQLFFMLPHRQWGDHVANASTLLLSLSSFGALFLLLRRYGFLFALLTVTLLLGVPLLSIHTGQGYGDIHVVEYLLLSAVFLAFSQERQPAVLLLSALFVAASAWVKQEGFFFGVMLFSLLLGSMCALGKREWRKALLCGALPAGLMGSLWTIFLLLRGLPLSPHGTEFLLGFHREALSPMFQALFSFGSFGIFFYVLPLLLALRSTRDTSARLPLAWGLSALTVTLLLYLLTPNVAFLLNGQAFQRTMLIPLSLLILGTALMLRRHAGGGERGTLA